MAGKKIAPDFSGGPGTGNGHHPCAVCGSAASEARWHVSDSLLHSPGTFEIVACVRCGTLRVDPLPPFAERRKSFSDDYPLFDWALGRKQAEPESRIARFSPQIAGINRRQRPGRLLDVGAGDGYFMLGMRNKGWEVRGIELHAGVASYAREQLGLDVVADAEHEVAWDGPYDCITLFGVLEDVDDPNACLERCYKNLAEDGLLVVQTHNIQSWEARYFGPDWFNIEAPRHVWHFSPGTLRQLLEKNGFSEEALIHHGAAFVTERSIENRRRRPFPSTMLDRLVRKFIVGPAARLAPRAGQGIMVDAYCRKRGAEPLS